MVYYAQTKNMALSSYFKVGLFVTLWIFCCGNECPKEALLVPADPIVTQNTHIQFECSVPSCLTDLSSDIWFGMKHTRHAFEEQKRGSVNLRGRLFANFPVNVTSSDASGVYFCHVSPAGLDDIETNANVSFVKVDKTPAVILVGEETIETKCLLEPIVQDLVITWGRTSASCDVSDNSHNVTFKKLEDANKDYTCYVASKKACANNEQKAVLNHTRDIIAAKVTRYNASDDQVKVTVEWMRKGKEKVEVYWLVDGQVVDGTRQSASSSLTVNRSVSLQAVFRLDGHEIKKNISIYISPNEEPGPLDDWVILTKSLGLTISLGLAFIVAVFVCIYVYNRGCCNTAARQRTDGGTTQNDFELEPLRITQPLSRNGTTEQ